MDDPSAACGPGTDPPSPVDAPALIGHSAAIQRLGERIRQVADSRSTVLISGESGTGKELVARALHDLSLRRDGPFIAVNCAAIPESLVEPELFGHERGAFTDAHTTRKGLFELADGGTLFLDEIGDLSLRAQGTLLRVLEDRHITRVGGGQSVPVDVRLVGATHVDLDRAIRAGRFREDLFYRLHVVPLVVPSLRERREDIPLLLRHFLARHAGPARTPSAIAPDAMDRLERYDWPGNVREMENLVEQLLTLCEGPVIRASDLPTTFLTRAHASELRELVRSGQTSLTDAVDAFERDFIGDALERAGHVQTRAARLLGVTRRILKYKMDALGIPVRRPRLRATPRRAA